MLDRLTRALFPPKYPPPVPAPPPPSGGDEYDIVYTWETATGGRNTLRRNETTLPSGTVMDYDYRSTSGRHDSDVSRATSIQLGGPLVATYAYNGVGQVVEMDYPEPKARSRRYGSTSGDYEDWDRFNRITSDDWTAYGGTATNFYDIDIAYDENSNITLIEDNVHSGFDVDYSMDELDRLTRAEEGTWGGSSITTTSRDQEWTLDQVGNWDVDKLDLDGDGSYTGTDEHNDDRTHNDVNELTARDTDDNGTIDFTLVYDAAGNLTDDGEEYKYEYDAFYRLRKVKDQSDALVAEHRYNGLGHRIGEHVDTDDDGDVDGSDEWRYFAYDERWRIVAHFLGSDTAPTEEFVHHAAGLDGRGGSSYIDLVALRERDTDDNGSREERMYYCQNWRADVSAIIDSNGEMYEWVKYSAYGVPFGLPGADTDSDGDCDATDITQIQTWIDAPSYDVRADADLDGDVDATDLSLAQASHEGASLGRSELSRMGNTAGLGGSAHEPVATAHHQRNRVYSLTLGKWFTRDPLGYVDGASLLEYVGSQPHDLLDPTGLSAKHVLAAGVDSGQGSACTPCRPMTRLVIQQSSSQGGCKFNIVPVVNAETGSSTVRNPGRCEQNSGGACLQEWGCSALFTVKFLQTPGCDGNVVWAGGDVPPADGGNAPGSTQVQVRANCGHAKTYSATFGNSQVFAKAAFRLICRPCLSPSSEKARSQSSLGSGIQEH